MESPEPGATPDPAVVRNSPTIAADAVKGDRLRPRRVWAMALTAGVAAGLVAWLVGELAKEAFQPRLFKIRVLLQTFIQPTTQSQNAADFKNAVLAFAILGAATGLAMGLAGGLVGRAASRGLIVGLGAGGLGAMAGALASLALLPLFYRSYVPDPNDWWSPILIHGGIWTAIGAVGGAAFAIGLPPGRRIPQIIVGACVGAVLATIVFHALRENFSLDSGGAAEPNAKSASVRLLARLLVTVFVAAGAARGAQGRRFAHDPDALAY